jgi:hypothetical protein
MAATCLARGARLTTVMLDLLFEWAPDAATCQSIVVDNPAELYGF